jgi:leucine rich repeat (LRR) protein
VIENPQVFRQLWMSGNPMLRHRLTHDEAPLEVWRAVIASLPEARETVAKNKSLPGELLVVLAADEDRRVREEVAGRRGLPRAAQAILVRDAETLVRHRLAFNRSLDQDLRLQLREDAEAMVRDAAATRTRESNLD